jgi:hypothetical protein
MGMHRSVYLGPYFEISVPVEDVRKDLCGHQPESKVTDFCDVCGKNLEKRFREEQVDVVDVDEIGGEDTFVRTPYISKASVENGRRTYYLLPNDTTCGIWLEEEEIAIEIDIERVKSETTEFVDKYIKHMKAIVRTCGVKPGWGLVQRYS